MLTVVVQSLNHVRLCDPTEVMLIAQVNPALHHLCRYFIMSICVVFITPAPWASPLFFRMIREGLYSS